MLLPEKAIKRFDAPEQIPIMERSLSMLEEKRPSFRGNLELKIEYIPASFADLPPAARLKCSIKPTRQSHTCSRSMGASYATTTLARQHKGINYLTPAEIYFKGKVQSIF